MLNPNNGNQSNGFFSQLKKEIKNKILIIGLIIFLVLISIVLSFYNGSTGQQGMVKNPSQEGQKENSNQFSGAKPTIIYSLSGIIKNIEPGTVFFEATLSFADESGKLIENKEMRKAIVGPQTQITALTYIIHKETNKVLRNETDISFEELKVGDHVEIIARENIKDQPEFLAKTIRVLPATVSK